MRLLSTGLADHWRSSARDTASILLRPRADALAHDARSMNVTAAPIDPARRGGRAAELFAALRLHDPQTAGHSRAVARRALQIGAALGLSADDLELLATAALLHDIGKLCMPASMLRAARPLSDHEWELIRTHPAEGARLLRKVGSPAAVVEAVLAHHERFDGAGYPFGLEGDAIPLAARIISVADTYDVLTTRDSYRAPVSGAEALTELQHVAGTQLDPDVVGIVVGRRAPRVYVPPLALAA